ncbi:MAG TPA: SDR family oxidoreductase [Candidatus Limnocylindrales bacterium]|nr:SDR family oxidoreductase [Candidatus Limnocylindrales bacterium]
MNRLADRVVLVTGSTGIAEAAAVRLAAEGAALFVASRTEAHARALGERLLAGGAAAGWRGADLTDERQVGDVVAACLERFGRIDGLLAVAGGSGRRLGDGPIHAVDGDAWDATLALNLRTQALVSGAVVRAMLAQEPNGAGSRGSIVLIGSVTATDPAPQHFATHAYAAARGATIALMRSMAATYARDRIRVNVVAPSLTDTPMAARAARDPEIRAFAAGKQPLAGELMDPAEVAHAVVYFLSDESRAVTGQLLKVDGGWSVTSFGGPVP